MFLAFVFNSQDPHYQGYKKAMYPREAQTWVLLQALRTDLSPLSDKI